MGVLQKASVLCCDFCGKDQDEVDLLITGPGDLAICDACVGICAQIIQEAKDGKREAEAPQAASAQEGVNA